MIYFLRCTGTPWVKIGWADDVIRRINDIQQYNPHRLQLVAVRNGKRKEESRLHTKFSEYRRIGEWFELSDELTNFIREQMRPDRYLDTLPRDVKYVVSIGQL
jgi:hypothetical protein